MNNNENNNKKYAEGEIVEFEKKEAVKIDSKGLKVRDNGNIIIGTLNVFTSPIKKRHEKHYKESKFHLLADLLLVFLVVLLLGVLFWSKFFTNGGLVSLSITNTSEPFRSSELEIIEIEYQNTSKDELRDARLVLDLPSGFEILKITPSEGFDKNNDTIELGNLASGANGAIKIEAYMFSEIGSRHNITTFLSYQTELYKQREVATYVFGVEDSLLKIDSEFDDGVYEYNQFDMRLSLKNKSSLDVESLEFELVSEDVGLVSVYSKGSAVSFTKNKWLLEGIEAGGQIDFDLKLLVSEAGDEEVTFKLYKNIGSEQVIQNEVSKTIAVKKPKLKSSIKAGDACIAIGKKNTYQLEIKNEEESDINNLKAHVSSSNPNFEISKISLDKDIDNRTLTIGRLSAFETKKTEFDVYFDRVAPALSQELGILLDWSYETEAGMVKTRTYSSNQKVASQVDVLSRLHYYSPEGDQLGIGPLPPLVEIPTAYWVFWGIDNYGNDLENFEMRAKLSPQINYADRKSLLSGDLDYNLDTNEIVWRVDNVEKQGDVNRVRFEVSVIPSKEMLGQVVKIFENQTYNYSESGCEVDYFNNLGLLDASLENDSFVSGSQEVRRQ